MLPSGSVNQTALIPPIEATPSFHSTPSVSKVANSMPLPRSSATSASNSAAGTSNVTEVALLVPAYADS